MSENFVTVAPGLTGLLANNGCILWKCTLVRAGSSRFMTPANKFDKPARTGYGCTKVKDEWVVDYRLALDADVGRCLREVLCAFHHCHEVSIDLIWGQKKTRRRTGILPVHRIRHQSQASCLSIE